MTLLLLMTILFVVAVESSQTSNDTVPETTTEYIYKPPKIGGCMLLPKPPHGRYNLIDPPYAEPGQSFDYMTFDLVCDPGYGIVEGRPRVTCGNGFWSWIFYGKKTECERFCATPEDERTEYRCPVQVIPSICYKYIPTGNIGEIPCPIPEGADKGYRPCKAYEPKGTVVQPVCNSCGNETLPKMICVEGGKWVTEEIEEANDTAIKIIHDRFIDLLSSNVSSSSIETFVKLLDSLEISKSGVSNSSIGLMNEQAN